MTNSFFLLIPSEIFLTHSVVSDSDAILQMATHSVGLPLVCLRCSLLLIPLAMTSDPCQDGILCKVPVKESTREWPVILS